MHGLEELGDEECRPLSPACRSWRITGIAVVTMRLSSVTMNTATEVIANAHSALGVIRSAAARGGRGAANTLMASH